MHRFTTLLRREWREGEAATSHAVAHSAVADSAVTVTALLALARALAAMFAPPLFACFLGLRRGRVDDDAGFFPVLSATLNIAMSCYCD